MRQSPRTFESWVATEIYKHTVFGAAGEALRLLDKKARTEEGTQRPPTLDEIWSACQEASFAVSRDLS